MEMGWETLSQEAAPLGPLATRVHSDSVSNLQVPAACQAKSDGQDTALSSWN